MTFNDDLPTAGEASGQVPALARRSRDPLAGPESDALLRRAADLVASGRPMPLSSSVMINRDEVLDLLGEAIDHLPEELRHARWLLKERQEFLARVQSEGDEILDQATAKAEAMVQRQEVVKAAEQRARRIIEDAQDEARRLRHECEDFCDQRLAQFEIVLNRTMKMVHAGREKLNASPMVASLDGPGSAPRDDAFDEASGPVPVVPDDVPEGGFGKPPGRDVDEGDVLDVDDDIEDDDTVADTDSPDGDEEDGDAVFFDQDGR